MFSDDDDDDDDDDLMFYASFSNINPSLQTGLFYLNSQYRYISSRKGVCSDFIITMFYSSLLYLMQTV